MKLFIEIDETLRVIFFTSPNNTHEHEFFTHPSQMTDYYIIKFEKYIQIIMRVLVSEKQNRIEWRGFEDVVVATEET